MKITLDHNCLIDLANLTEAGQTIKSIIDSPKFECSIVNIGASEMRENGILPDRYDLFDKFLMSIGVEKLERISPMFLFDVTFLDYSILSDDKMSELAKRIELVLFSNPLKGNIEREGLDSLFGKKWLNRLCDVHSMWSHINNENDIFLTSDKNFMKKTKLPNLILLGAKSIKHPFEIDI